MKAVVDIIALAILAWYVFQGVRRGFSLSVLNIAGALCAYVAAYRLSPQIGAWMEEALGIDAFYAKVLGGGAVFFAVLAVFGTVGGVIRARQRKRAKADKIPTLSPIGRLAGGAIGLILGVSMITVVWWVYDAMRAGPWGAEFPDLQGSAAAGAARAVVRTGAEAALRGELGPERAEQMAALLSAPGETAEEIMGLLDEPAVQELFASERFREDFMSGDAERIEESRDYQALFRDENVIERLGRLGYDAQAEEGDLLPARVAEQLAAGGARLGTVLEDPETEPVLAELREEGVFEEPDLKTLFLDPRIRKIAGQVLEGLATPLEDEAGLSDD